MRLTTISFVLGSVLETFATNIGLLCLGRLVSGLGCGAAIVVVPIYIAEVAPPKEKGLFGAFTQISINVGILVAQLLGYFLSRGNLWRIILVVSGGIAILHLAGLVLVPESPRWLAEHRSPQDAREILLRIRGHKVDVDAEVKAWNIDASANDICSSVNPSRRPLLMLPQPKKRLFSALPQDLIQLQTPRLLQHPSVSGKPSDIPHTSPPSSPLSPSCSHSSSQVSTVSSCTLYPSYPLSFPPLPLC